VEPVGDAGLAQRGPAPGVAGLEGAGAAPLVERDVCGEIAFHARDVLAPIASAGTVTRDHGSGPSGTPSPYGAVIVTS
jgi:hypothetical protein